MSAAADEKYMRLALELALRGRGGAEPNPCVGAVVVKDGEVVGRGWHDEFGGPHAEINALREAAHRSHGAALYVTLEPCSYRGKTPPCVNAVIEAGITRVIAGTEDPNPRVSGNGFRQLAAAGVRVDVGVLEESARELIADFAGRRRAARPFVALKWAMSLDGKIAAPNRDSKWITGEVARRYVHVLRSRYGAVLTGMGTVRQDNPLLTARIEDVEQPRRIVLDTRLEMNMASCLAGTVADAPLTLVHGPDVALEKRMRFSDLGAELFEVGVANGRLVLSEVLDVLGRAGVEQVFVEAGPRLMHSFVAKNLADKIFTFVAPKVIGGPMTPTGTDNLYDSMENVLNLAHPRCVQTGCDVMISGLIPKRP